MSSTAGLAQQRLHDAEPTSAPVRPKVMRRPNHFSSAPTMVPEPAVPLFIAPEKSVSLPVELDLSQPTVPAVPATPRKSWQDDAQFGAVMVLIVLLTNIVLMLWLPHIRHTTPPSAPVAEADMPIAEPGHITLYTKPLADLPDDDMPNSNASSEVPVHVLGATIPQSE